MSTQVMSATSIELLSPVPEVTVSTNALAMKPEPASRSATEAPEMPKLTFTLAIAAGAELADTRGEPLDERD